MAAQPDRAAAPVVGIREDYEATDGPFHRHQRAQLVYSVSGVTTVTTECGVFVVPPERAVWVRGGERHRVTARRPIQLRTLYFDDARVKGPRETQVVAVGPLLRELVLAVVDLDWSWRPGGREARLVRVLSDELARVDVAPLSLPLPDDPRLRRVCDALAADPSDGRDLAAFAKTAGASARHLARLFRAETGMTFGAWRERLRLLRSLEQLARGDSVLAVALDLGYASASSFGAMFKRAFRTSPARYFAEKRAEG